ncbi:MAG: YdcF family protein [Pseudomonadota bacterium]
MRDLVVSLLFPLGTSLCLFALSGLALILKRPRLGATSAGLALSWLYLWSMPAFTSWAIEHHESDWPLLSATEASEGDVIVSLGGAFLTAEDWPSPDANQSVDRHWFAARLYHAGKAPRIIVSGGLSRHRPVAGTEAAAAFGFLTQLGVPPDAITQEARASTTWENAQRVAELLQDEDGSRLLLVTSALHMRRSVAAFEAAGLDVIPLATDPHWGRAGHRGIHRFLPSAGALADSSRLFHEWIGLAWYRLRGWA